MPLVEVNGHSLFYKRWSPPAAAAANKNATTILMIHGLGSTHSFYATVAPGLAAAGFDCIAIDSCGSGLSPPPAADEGGLINISASSLAADAVSALAALGVALDRTIITGHSLGGLVALLAAAAGAATTAATTTIRPPSPLAVVALGPVHPNPTTSTIMAQRADTVLAAGGTGTGSGSGSGGSVEPLADAISEGPALGPDATPAHRAFVRALLLSQTPRGYAATCRAIADASAADAEAAYADLGGRRGRSVPVLVVAGLEDRTAPLEGCEAVVRGCGGGGGGNEKKKAGGEGVGEEEDEDRLVRLATVPGLGHWHCIEKPAEIGALIQGFAEDVLLRARSSRARHR